MDIFGPREPQPPMTADELLGAIAELWANPPVVPPYPREPYRLLRLSDVIGIDDPDYHPQPEATTSPLRLDVWQPGDDDEDALLDR